MIPTRQNLIDYLHLFVLVSMALAQPLYDLLGRYADFFVAHGAGNSVILCLVAVVSILAPVLLSLAEAIAGLVFGQAIRRTVHLVISGILAGLIVLPPLNRLEILPDAVVCIAAVLAGGIFVFIYAKWKFMRSFLTAMAPAVLIFPAYFLFFTPVKNLVFQKADIPHSDIEITNEVPVILIIFDEFSTMALLDQDGNIDSVRYPNFASLAGESFWFPDATCSSLETMKSVPAILTGKMPPETKHKLATYAYHPDNLFTLLAGHYYFNIHETETAICPETIRRHSQEMDPASFISDITTLCRILFVPGLIKYSSTFLGGRWRGFDATIPLNAKGIPSGILSRKRQIEGFINGIYPGRRNQLDFMHLELPHLPYEFLSSGRSYNNMAIFPEGIQDEKSGWVNSAELAEVAYQRYLQQVGFTDKVLGSIMNGLREKGIYDESLLIITADHGVSMRPGRPRRSYYEGNQHEIIKVPAFVKLPHQSKGKISRALIGGVDIMPTIASVLGISLPWDHDGESMMPHMTGKKESTKNDKVRVHGIGEFTRDDIEGFPMLEWQTSVFGSGTPLASLVRRDSYQVLLGKDIKDLDIRSVIFPYTVEVENVDQFKSIEPGSGYLPALLRGHVSRSGPEGETALAIALNGKIQATAKTSKWQEENAFFNALLPEAAFHQGVNELEVFMIQGGRNGMDPYLVRIPIENGGNIVIRPGRSGGELLVFDDGREIPVNPQPAGGYMDSFHLNDYRAVITGWAYDKQEDLPVQSVVIFQGMNNIAQAKPGVERKDIVSALETEKARYCGFRVEIPVNAFSGENIRAFGITGRSKAYELKITGTARESMERFFRRRF